MHIIPNVVIIQNNFNLSSQNEQNDLSKGKLGRLCSNFGKWCKKLRNSIWTSFHNFLSKSMSILHLPEWSLLSIMQLSANEDKWFWNTSQLFIWFPSLRSLFQYQKATIFFFFLSWGWPQGQVLKRIENASRSMIHVAHEGLASQLMWHLHKRAVAS